MTSKDRSLPMLRQLSVAAFVLPPIGSYFFITPFTGVFVHRCYLLSLVCVFGPRTIKTEHLACKATACETEPSRKRSSIP